VRRTRRRRSTEFSQIKIPALSEGTGVRIRFPPGESLARTPINQPTRPPAILLRESYREAGKTRNRTLANLSGWPAERIEQRDLGLWTGTS